MNDSYFFDSLEIVNPDYSGKRYNARQHINLSQFAWDIIENDMFIFKGYDCELSTIINLIIQKYAPYSDANFCVYYKKFTSSLQPLFSTLTLSADDIETANITLLKNAIDTHYNTYYRHPKEVGKKIHLSNTSVNTLLTIGRNLTASLNNGNIPDIPDDIMYHYKRLGLFLTAVIEDYVTRPFFEREKYILSDHIETIESAINTGTILKATHANGKTLYIKPYLINLNKQKTYYYVCGYFSHDGINYYNKPSSTKLSNLIRIDDSFETFKFSKEKLAMINKRIQTDEIQFISSSDRLSPDFIKVYLTDAGIRTYRQIGNIRPQYTHIEDKHFYFFDCTEIQAFYYFQSFGKDAVILEPGSLREKMKDFHEKGAEAYSK